jgi:hypothetical protein
MKLNYFEMGFFPFCVPEMGASFASSVGPQTVYPAGFGLDQALQIYWRAKDYQLVATGSGMLDGVSQALSINGTLAPRNATVNTGLFGLLTGFVPTGPADLVCGFGLKQTVPGSGTITASGSGGSGTGSAVFNLVASLFYPQVYAPNPMIQYNGLWWPMMGISCQVTNTVPLGSGGALALTFDCTTLPSTSSTTALGSFSFFGVDVPVFCNALSAGETRSFSGALTVADEWT